MNNNDEVRHVLKNKANKLAHLGYDLTFKFPKEELYCLTSQVRRALISVPSNIIEGYSRYSKKEFLHFIKISFASLAEVKYQMSFAVERGYISEDDSKEFMMMSEEVSKMLWSSINTLHNSINS